MTVPPQETLKPSKAGLAQSLVGFLGPVHKRFSLSTPNFSGRYGGFILNAVSHLRLFPWCFSFALGCRISFLGGIQHCPVNGCSAASCYFGVLTGDEYTSYSAISNHSVESACFLAFLFSPSVRILFIKMQKLCFFSFLFLSFALLHPAEDDSVTAQSSYLPPTCTPHPMSPSRKTR